MRGMALAMAVMGGLAGMAGLARGDVIALKDGRQFSGTMARRGDVMRITTDDGAVIDAKPEDVSRVTLTGTVPPAQAAAAEWTRVSAQIRAADTLEKVIALSQGYLDKYPDAANAAGVRESMKQYRALAAAGGVKFRGRWVARGDIDLILHTWAAAAKPGEALYRAGKMKEALDAEKTALDADKENPDALTVAGLAAWRLGNLPAARTYFTALAAADPGSVLAENNLAVVSFGQKQAGEGIFHYGRALQIAPGNRLLLDNIVEAMSAYLAANDGSSDTFKAVQRQFDVAEKKMEEVMAAKGLVRRGSTWIDKGAADEMALQETALRTQLAGMTGQLSRLQATITSLDAQIRQLTDDYNAAVSAVVVDNTAIAGADPRRDDIATMIAARELAAQNANRADLMRRDCQSKRDQAAAGVRDLTAQAGGVQATLRTISAPVPGTQRIMDLGEDQNPPPPATMPGA